MIRLPSIPGLQGTALNEPGVNPRAAAAPAAALGVVAESIAKVSDQFHDTALRIQKMENGRLLSAKRTELAEGYAALQLDLQKDPDPASRLEKTRAFFTTSKGLMDSAELPPAVRDELLAHHDGFATNAMIRQGEDSARLAMRRAGLQFQNEFDAAKSSRDRGAAERAGATAVAAGAALPEEVDKALTQFDQEATYRAHQESISLDPLTAEKELATPDYLDRHPNLTPESHAALKRQAEHEANRYRADFTNDLVIAGADPSEEDLAEMESRGVIDKATHARWLSRKRAAVVPKDDPALYNETYTQIAQYDPAKDPSGRVEAQLRAWVASQPLPPESIKELNERLSKRINPVDSKKPKSVHESSFASKIAVDFNRGDWGKFRFPIDHDKNPDTAPIMRVTQAEYDKAWKLRGQFTDQWRAILETLPEDAGFDAVNSAYEALKTSFKDKKPLPDLKFSKPAAPAFDPEKTYQSTLPKGSFGGQPIQEPGMPYTGATATVFGGPNDPADNGQSALGGKTGAGGREGTAIPQDLLQAKFPGKDKAWIERNVRTVVTDPGGVTHTLPVADFGTAEWVWQRNGRPTLDLTEGAAKQLGGQVIYRKGKLADVRGLEKVDFSVVSIDTGGKELAGMTWEDAKAAWFQTNRPRSYEAASNSLIALRDAWNQENAGFASPLAKPDAAKDIRPLGVAKPGDSEVTNMESTIIDANTRITEGANY